MSQAQQSENSPVQENHKHSENAKLEANFGLSWRDLEIGACFSAVGTAVRVGGKKLELFMSKVLQLTLVIAVCAVSLVCLFIFKSRLD